MPTSVMALEELSPKLRAALQHADVPSEIDSQFGGTCGDTERPGEVTTWMDQFLFPCVAGDGVGGAARQRAADQVQWIVDAVSGC